MKIKNRQHDRWLNEWYKFSYELSALLSQSTPSKPLTQEINQTRSNLQDAYNHLNAEPEYIEQ